MMECFRERERDQRQNCMCVLAEHRASQALNGLRNRQATELFAVVPNKIAIEEINGVS